MLNAIVAFARNLGGLKVIPLCHYVRAQFLQRPEEFADVWNPEEQKEKP
jgi:predicted GNAT family acetyltransferase